MRRGGGDPCDPDHTSLIAPLFYRETRIHTKYVIDAFLLRWYFQKKKEIADTQKSGIEKSQMNKLKILDGMTAYIISLALFALAYVWGTEYIGVWALYIAAALSIGAVMVLTKIT